VTLIIPKNSIAIAFQLDKLWACFLTSAELPSTLVMANSDMQITESF
jgi:hypothetical protein